MLKGMRLVCYVTVGSYHTSSKPKWTYKTPTVAVVKHLSDMNITNIYTNKLQTNNFVSCPKLDRIKSAIKRCLS